MRKFSLTTCLSLSLAFGNALASNTNIAWNKDRFEHSMQIAPGKVAEVCGDVFPERPIEWRFTASDITEFNIHRHDRSDVIYHTRSFRTKEQAGTFAPKEAHEWCWMWTNESPNSISIRVHLRRM
jgi:hypothetical protein